MLVLTRKPAETIRIGRDIVVKVIKTGSGSVKIGIDAPQSVRVLRGEKCETDPEAVVPAASATATWSGPLSDQFPHVA